MICSGGGRPVPWAVQKSSCPQEPELPGPGGAAGGREDAAFEAAWEGLMPPGARLALQGSQGIAVGGDGIRGLSRALCTQSVPWRRRWRAPLRMDAHFPLFMLLQHSHSFRLSKLETFHKTPFQPEPPLWPAWLAATSLRSRIPGAVPSLPKLGPHRVPPSPGLVLVGEKVGGRRGAGPGHSRVCPPCLPPRVPKMGVGAMAPEGGVKERAAAGRNPETPSLPLGRV